MCFGNLAFSLPTFSRAFPSAPRGAAPNHGHGHHCACCLSLPKLRGQFLWSAPTLFVQMSW